MCAQVDLDPYQKMGKKKLESLTGCVGFGIRGVRIKKEYDAKETLSKCYSKNKWP